MYAVQSLDWEAPVEYEPWVVLQVEPRNCQAFLRLNLEALPKHVKRVRRSADGGCDVLVCRVAAQNTEQLEQWQAGSGRPDVPPGRANVATSRPLTREQWDKACEAWPCHWTESVPPTAPPPVGARLERWKALMQEAAQVGGCVIATLDGEVVGRGGNGEPSLGFDGHAVVRAVRAVAEAAQATDSSQLFCTGYVAFCTHEPCAMCAMVLVHARVESVVFGTLCVEGGALAEAVRLGCHPQLNHHYNVYYFI